MFHTKFLLAEKNPNKRKYMDIYSSLILRQTSYNLEGFSSTIIYFENCWTINCDKNKRLKEFKIHNREVLICNIPMERQLKISMDSSFESRVIQPA